jgi:hypothetical protein
MVGYRRGDHFSRSPRGSAWCAGRAAYRRGHPPSRNRRAHWPRHFLLGLHRDISSDYLRARGSPRTIEQRRRGQNVSWLFRWKVLLGELLKPHWFSVKECVAELSCHADRGSRVRGDPAGAQGIFYGNVNGHEERPHGSWAERPTSVGQSCLPRPCGNPAHVPQTHRPFQVGKILDTVIAAKR